MGKHRTVACRRRAMRSGALYLHLCLRKRPFQVHLQVHAIPGISTILGVHIRMYLVYLIYSIKE